MVSLKRRKANKTLPVSHVVLGILGLAMAVLILILTQFTGDTSLSAYTSYGTLLSSTEPPQAAKETIASPVTTTKERSNICLNDDFVPQEKVAVWTMLNDYKGYIQGAIKIAVSIKEKTKTPVDLVVMEVQHKPLTEEEWVNLRSVGWKRCTVERVPPPKRTRKGLGEKYAVLHVWAMTVYDRVLFLDADSYPQNSVDPLLEMDLGGKPVGVTKDIRGGEWVETFNSGVMILHPSKEEHTRLLGLLNSGLEFDFVMSDQGFLNEVYKNNWHEIGFVNNANLALYKFKRKFWNSHKVEDLNVIHYTMQKPWQCGVNGQYGPICRIWKDAKGLPSETT